ncbi:MAG: OmpA family protein [Deltaproteobacteria bacterium]|nr:OmpA family protein [Deltaproteobacteria bacterium]
MRPLAIALLLAAALGPAGARADDAARRGFDPDPPRPALGLDGQLTTEGAGRLPAGSWALGLQLEYVRGLLSLKSGSDRIGYAVDDRWAAHLSGAYALRRLELSAGLPVALHQVDGLRPLRELGVGRPLTDPISAAGLGDLRLQGRTTFLSQETHLVNAGAALELRVPTGDRRAFLSDGWGLHPRLLAGRSLGPLRLDASLGYHVRRQGQFLQLVAQDGVTTGLAAALELARWSRVQEWKVIADLSGLFPRGAASHGERYRIPLSGRVALRARLWRSLWADVGVGTGLAWFGEAGYGREALRVFAGLRWQHLSLDRDGDGVPDDDDRCPDVPGPVEWGGCPTAPDRDGDGVPDDRDRCPDVPGPKELDGCPDRDGDGVPDHRDRCPDVPGPRDLDGCPDQDGDGIPDVEDQCPTLPGPAQNDGCPLAEGEPVVEIETTRLSLRDMIHFDTAKDTIKAESNHILDEIGAILRSHREIQKVRVEGHTDSVGSRAYNLDLSQRRASSVVRALTARGVAAARLEAVGYGFDRPVASNSTPLGRAKNRRVEFTLVGESDPPEGGEKK